MSDLIVANIDGQLLVDSRLIAERLGIQHESLARTITRYATQLQAFGHLRFEIGTVTNSVGATNTTKFAYLNEAQSTLLMTFSKNTQQVVECKVALVDAFEKAKAIIATVIPAQSDRIRELELELQIRKQEQKLLDTRNTIVTTCPKPIADRILGITEVKEVEYRDRVITRQGVQDEGVGITWIQKRYGFKTTKAAWAWLESIGIGKDSSKWHNTLAAVTRQSLPWDMVDELDVMAQDGIRQQFLGE